MLSRIVAARGPRRAVEILVVAFTVVVVGGGCTRAQPRREGHPGTLPVVALHPEGAPEARVVIELARTEAERQRGLMYRSRLEPDHGMLFLFERPEPLSFWMRNTYIPLDMIFLGADHRVVGVVENAEPLTDDARRVEGNSQFVLEVPGGWSAAHHIAPGTRADFLDVD